MTKENMRLQAEIDNVFKNSIKSINNNKNKKFEFTKILSLIILSFSFIMIVVSYVLSYKLENVDYLGHIDAFRDIIIAVFGFYTYKSRAENKIKLETIKMITMSILKKFFKDDFVEANESFDDIKDN